MEGQTNRTKLFIHASTRCFISAQRFSQLWKTSIILKIQSWLLPLQEQQALKVKPVSYFFEKTCLGKTWR